MSKSLTDLREALFETIAAVKSGALELDKARQINDVAKTIVDTAKVEVDYLRVAGGGESEFIGTENGANKLPPGITGVTRHRLAG